MMNDERVGRIKDCLARAVSLRYKTDSSLAVAFESGVRFGLEEALGLAVTLLPRGE